MEVSRRRVRDIYQVVCPENLTKYHQNMDGVDQVNQLQDHCDGLSFKSRFESVTNLGT